MVVVVSIPDPVPVPVPVPVPIPVPVPVPVPVPEPVPVRVPVPVAVTVCPLPVAVSATKLCTRMAGMVSRMGSHMVEAVEPPWPHLADCEEATIQPVSCHLLDVLLLNPDSTPFKDVPPQFPCQLKHLYICSELCFM